MKRLLSFCLILFSVVTARGQEEVKPPVDHSVNFGIKVGFNSSMYLVSDFKLGNVSIRDVQNNYKIGYLASAFMRLNMGDHFIQPELSYQVSKSQLTFDKRGNYSPDGETEQASINSTIHSMELPVLYGYNIIKRKPYAMSVFIGPKIKYLWNKRNKITFENLYEDLEEELRPLNISATAGVAVNISRIIFDFRYEYGFNNISKSIRRVRRQSGTEEVEIAFDRRENLLSFSLGVMF